MKDKNGIWKLIDYGLAKVLTKNHMFVLKNRITTQSRLSLENYNKDNKDKNKFTQG